MHDTDDYGQGVPIALLSETPDANSLIAPVVNALAQRAVLRFASATQRDATLTSLAPGMVAWLIDAKLLTLYDGAAWVVVSAGTQAWTKLNPLPAGFTHNGNSQGDVEYRLVNLFGEPWLQLRGGVAVSYTGSTIPNDGIITSSPLPAAARPTTLRTISVPCSDTSSSRITLKMDAQTGGHLKIHGTGSGNTPPWVSFNGCSYSL